MIPFDIVASARATLHENGFSPEFSAEVRQQLATLPVTSPGLPAGVRDLRDLPWSSIDNDESRDLDQIEMAEQLPDGDILVRVGIADVDAYVPAGSPIDQHAASETVTVYAQVVNFPMLPEALSTGLTSLLPNQDRLCVVTEMRIAPDGRLHGGDVYRALVRSRAQLTYNAVGDWLDGKGELPISPEIQSQLRLQDEAAQRMRAARERHGALNIETIEAQAIVRDGRVLGIEAERKTRASELIEDFMIGANETVARLLADRQIPSIRRVVRTPERWNRIVELAARFGETLPPEPDSKALDEFLSRQREQDPLHSPDLSLAVVKLLGPGEYVVEGPGDPREGHFSLAVQDYTHSTAPNRRYTDLVTQRQLKALVSGTPSPYTADQLIAIALHCTKREDAARKVERVLSKRLAALALQHRVGERFPAIVTGVKSTGVFVRVIDPPVEGRVIEGEQGLDVGDPVNVRLIETDPARGYIDFGCS